MAHPLVVHCKKAPFDVYIGRGRGSRWGNQFTHLPDVARRPGMILVSSREEAVACYEAWLLDHPEVLARAVRELRGKRLGCWCDPQACHGWPLAKYANAPGLIGLVVPGGHGPRRLV
jgi:hypothetical protein